MRVTQIGLLDFLGLEDIELTLPLYQRRYSWTTRQCKELWLDIMRAGRSDQNHFSGTILSSRCDSDSRKRILSIIDGQQRLTTITIMLIAFRNFLMTHQVETPLSPKEIESKFLLSKSAESDDSQHAKFTLSEVDNRSLEDAINGRSPDTLESKRVASNLKYFEDLMCDDGFDAPTFLKGLNNLQAIWAILEPEDDAQAIFESLNSKGMQLNIGDMVRNYLLATESHEQQTHFYDEYWTVIEGVFDPDPGSLRLDTMVKAWLSVRFPKVRARKPEDVYSAFKQYYNDEYAGDLEPVLVELRSFSMVWAENYRYHAVKKFKSRAWAINGEQTLTSNRKLKKADNEEFAEREREKLRRMASEPEY